MSAAVLAKLERLDRSLDVVVAQQRSPEHAVEWARCKADPAYFLSTYAKVSDPATLQTLDFALWPHLEYLLELWQRERLCIVLKARQLGVSWLLAGYALWKVKFHTNANTLLLSKNQDDASDLLAKARFIEGSLPEWLQDPRGKDNGSELEFPHLGGRVRALPSTANAGRGNTASLVIPDEFAFHAYSRENYLALMPTLGSSGQMFIVSTANGFENLYQEVWEGADPDSVIRDTGDGIWTLPEERGANGFAPVFLHWSCRPGRDEAWLEAERARYDDPKAFAQEYPSNPTEAFRVSGSLVFDGEALALVFDDRVKGTPFSINPSMSDVARHAAVYVQPVKGHRYLLGADVAQGLAHADASCAVVLDAQTGEEVAHYHTNSPPDVFAAGLHQLGSAYPSRVGVERNGPGHQVLYKLRELQRPDTLYKLFYDRHSPLKAQAGRIPSVAVPTALPGWVTSGASKPLMIGELEAAVRNGHIKIHSTLAYTQMRMYQRLANGETSAPPTKHDDCVVACAIAWQMRKEPIETSKRPVHLETGIPPKHPQSDVPWPTA